MNFNRPHMQLPGQPPNTSVRWVHQPLSLTHGDFSFSIKENGKVVIKDNSSTETDPETKEVTWDEMELPASLIYKISRYLQDTRTAHFVPLADK